MLYLHGLGCLAVRRVDLANVLQQQLLALEGLVAHVTHVGRQLLVDLWWKVENTHMFKLQLKN